MKKLLLLIALSFISASCVFSASITQMIGSTLDSIMSNKEKNKEYLVLDVREKDEYEDFHILYAINISVNEIENRLSEISDWKDKNIIAVCRSGRRSMAAARILVKNGFNKVFNAEGVGSYNYKNLTKVKNLTGKQFSNLIKTQKTFILDVREKKDYKTGHIKGAYNIPLSDLENNLNNISKTSLIAVYASSKEASFAAADVLTSKGCNVINCLDGVHELLLFNIFE